MKKEPNIKNGTRSNEQLDSARQLWLSITCNIRKKKTQIWIVLYIQKEGKPREFWSFILHDSIQKLFQGKGKGAIINHHLGSLHPNEFQYFPGNTRHLLKSLTVYISTRLKAMMQFHLYPNLNKAMYPCIKVQIKHVVTECLLHFLTQ